MGEPGAREWWLRLEPLHAVVYFDEGRRASMADLGLRGFWMGYFAGRAAPLGPVGPDVVAACFCNFAPGMVARSLPDARATAAAPGAGRPLFAATRATDGRTTRSRRCGTAAPVCVSTGGTATWQP